MLWLCTLFPYYYRCPPPALNLNSAPIPTVGPTHYFAAHRPEPSGMHRVQRGRGGMALLSGRRPHHRLRRARVQGESTGEGEGEGEGEGDGEGHYRHLRNRMDRLCSFYTLDLTLN